MWRAQLEVGKWYTYAWDRMGRKGQRCIVQALSHKMNSVQVEFEDGHQAITSQNALKSLNMQALVTKERSFF
jgi:hypothetical protein